MSDEHDIRERIHAVWGLMCLPSDASQIVNTRAQHGTTAEQWISMHYLVKLEYKWEERASCTNQGAIESAIRLLEIAFGRPDLREFESRSRAEHVGILLAQWGTES